MTEYKTVTVSADDQPKLAEILNGWAAKGWVKDEIKGPGPDGRMIIVLSREKPEAKGESSGGGRRLDG